MRYIPRLPRHVAGTTPLRQAIVLVCAALLLTGITPAPGFGSERPGAAKAAKCLHQLARGTSEMIRCTFPTVMTTKEREELRRLTRGLVRDAHCLVRVKIARERVAEALAAFDHTFIAPPQPATCEVETREETLTFEFTFAPRVEFENGRAVTATPGMSEVKGVSPVIGWPVRQWVNRAAMIEEGMLKAINAYKEHHAKQARR